jgi:hypothetical protein
MIAMVSICKAPSVRPLSFFFRIWLAAERARRTAISVIRVISGIDVEGIQSPERGADHRFASRDSRYLVFAAMCEMIAVKVTK